ncbi:MAG: nucleoside deaminase [Mucilaginibacter sp.]|nr:nucleoside deaminase [Mucilaginibacter sp.]
MRYYTFGDEPAISPDDFFMKEALREAKLALAEGEIPIGAIVVCNGQIIGRGHNLTERLTDVSAHAEMQALTASANFLGGKYLKDCTLYVTMEPCVMCAGASYWFQLSKIVFGAYDTKLGFGRLNQKITHPKTVITGGIRENECAELVRSFFKNKRGLNQRKT